MESNTVCPVMMGWRNAGGVITALPCIETGLTLRMMHRPQCRYRAQNWCERLWYFISLQWWNDKIQADVIMRKRKTAANYQYVFCHRVRRVPFRPLRNPRRVQKNCLRLYYRGKAPVMETKLKLFAAAINKELALHSFNYRNLSFIKWTLL